MCPYELALKLHELDVNSESEFYFVKEMKGGGSQTESVTQNTMRYSYRKEGDLIPAYMSHDPAEIRIFTDNGLICLSITSVYLSGGR